VEAAIATSDLSAGHLLVVAGSTACIYLFLIVLLRVFGRRQLGQLTALDLVVILVLGSAVETSMIHGDTSLVAGLISAATLLVINGVLTLIFLRSPRLSHLVNGGPILLVHNGRVLDEHLHRVGLTLPDLEAAIRARGDLSATDLREVVLETDGTISVVER
jgi:uncharacterized membrane protein YcaP (DUF421 family)